MGMGLVCIVIKQNAIAIRIFLLLPQDEHSILTTLAAILHMCDVTFEPSGEHGEASKITNPEKATVAAQLLEVDHEELLASLIQEASVMRGWC